MNRRAWLKGFIGAAATLPSGCLGAPTPVNAFAAEHAALLKDIAFAVLPESLRRRGTDDAADQFLRWMRNYRAGAVMDGGYGVIRQQKAPPLPLEMYATQLRALDRGSRANGSAFGALPIGEQRNLVQAAMQQAHIEELPIRPAGEHIVADLMAHYFRSPGAIDLCYRAAIRRFDCRGLYDATRAPASLARG